MSSSEPEEPVLVPAERDGSVGWSVRVTDGLNDEETLGVLAGYLEHLKILAASSWHDSWPTDRVTAWYLFSCDTRELFRAAADVDDTTWARGRGWALCLGLGSEHYYRIKNPALATVGRKAMFEAIADYRSGD